MNKNLLTVHKVVALKISTDVSQATGKRNKYISGPFNTSRSECYKTGSLTSGLENSKGEGLKCGCGAAQTLVKDLHPRPTTQRPLGSCHSKSGLEKSQPGFEHIFLSGGRPKIEIDTRG